MRKAPRIVGTAMALMVAVFTRSWAATEPLAHIMAQWESRHGALDLPTLTLSYEAFLGDIVDTRDREAQEAFFSETLRRVADLDASSLTATEALEAAILRYESERQLQQLALLADWPADARVDDAGIHHQPGGRAWYRYLVRHWTTTAYTPEEIEAYGRREVARIKRTMQALAPLADEPPRTESEAAIEAAFAAYEASLRAPLAQHFPDFPDLPGLSVERGMNPALAQVPGYYGGNRIAYNLFDEPFDLSQIPWLYLHEGNPGHHFQLAYEGTRDVPGYRADLSYSGFREGWAAYVEEVAHEIGLYPTDPDRLKQLEWDLIRSTRLILDVGINDRGWSNQEALAEWQKHVEGLDDIGMREIRRMRRWPAQVLTYKLGAKAILEARETSREALGDRFSLKDFHTALLSERSIPLELIGDLVSRRGAASTTTTASATPR